MGTTNARQGGTSPPDRKSVDRTSATAAKLAFFDRLTVEPDLTHLDCRIAWRLLHYTHGVTGIAWPSYDRLADDVGCDKRSAMRSVKRLVGKGWFNKSSRTGRSNSNRYTPNLERVTGESSFKNETESSKAERVTSESLKGDSRGTERVTPGSPESLKNPWKESLTGASAASPPDGGGTRAGTETGDLQLRVFGQFAGGQAKQVQRDREDDKAMAESLGIDVELVVELREVTAIAQVGWSVAKCVAVDVGMRGETADMDGTERVGHMIKRYSEMVEEAAKVATATPTEEVVDGTAATAAGGA